MNRVNYEQTGGFPLDTTNLNFLQNCFRLLNSFGDLAGNKAIISGCEPVGNAVSDGVVYLNGEVFEFRSGTLGTSVIIKEEAVSGTFEDGSFKPIEVTRYMTFGSSTPEKTYQWADFKRFDNLIENTEKNLDFDKRLKALETKKSPVPIGLIAIWGKPETEPIPEGWQEYTGLRGRFPLGWNPDDEEFNEIEKMDGDKDHILTIEEMPSHSHPYSDVYFAEAGGSVALPGGLGSGRSDNDNRGHEIPRTTGSAGGNKPHNNMPPYRIIRYIEFVGFKIKAK